MRRLPSRWLWPRSVKKWLPTTLFGRSLLIIILPVAIMQVVVTWVFFDAHWEAVTSRLSSSARMPKPRIVSHSRRTES